MAVGQGRAMEAISKSSITGLASSLRRLRIGIDDDVTPDAYVTDLCEPERMQRVSDGMTLRVEDSGARDDVDRHAISAHRLFAFMARRHLTIRHWRTLGAPAGITCRASRVASSTVAQLLAIARAFGRTGVGVR
jgi:hypothetical protein